MASIHADLKPERAQVPDLCDGLIGVFEEAGLGDLEVQVARVTSRIRGWPVFLRCDSGPSRAETPAAVGWWGLWGRFPVSGRECGGAGQEA